MSQSYMKKDNNIIRNGRLKNIDIYAPGLYSGVVRPGLQIYKEQRAKV